jgi:threonyl-tRNA synthetase
MIHRAVLGSLERFFGILIENYAGDFPLWLAPTQARILPVTNNEVRSIYFAILSRVVKLFVTY